MRKFISESKAHTRSDIARDIYKGRQTKSRATQQQTRPEGSETRRLYSGELK